MNTIYLGLISLAFATCNHENLHQDSPGLQRFTFTEPHMGTRFRIVLYAADKETAEKAAKAAFQRIAKLDAMMSDFRKDSELMQLCQRAVRKPVRASEDLFEVIARAQEVSKLTNGAFDITVGPYLRLWRRARKNHELPDPGNLAAARALVGYQNIHLDAKARTVRLLKPGMQLDLGGIAKGYAAERALDELKNKGIDRALVAAGGDIAVSGPPPQAKGWKIGIAPLEDPNAKPRYYLLLRDEAVSTSGDSEQYVEIAGKRHSHIVDPKTGIGLLGRRSVTVIARQSSGADSLATAICVLGPKQGLELLDRLEGIAGLIVQESGNKIETFESKRFKSYLHPNPEGEKEKRVDGPD